MWSSRAAFACRARLSLLCAALLTTGCVEHALHEARLPRSYAPIPTAPAAEPAEGAIWRGGTASGSFLYFDRKARGPGDLVTVLVVESFSAVGSASTSLDKSSSIGADLSSDLGFTDLVRQATTWLLERIGVDNPGGGVAAGPAASVIQSNADSSFAGDGATSRQGRLNAVVTCRVVEELPGGLFHVLGRRQIVVNHELQLLTVEGLVRRDDISIHNTIPSTALAEARLTFDGIGVIDDKQRPPLFARIMDWIYPF